MNEDLAPRVPDLWFSPSEKALWEKGEDGYFCPDYYPIRSSDALPADAVKLGDVEALKAKLATILTGWRTTALSTGDVYESIRAIVEGENR